MKRQGYTGTQQQEQLVALGSVLRDAREVVRYLRPTPG